jgi:DNA modification methylase
VSAPLVIGNATLYRGDCLDVLKTLPDCSVQCCVTSPPYFGLRDYGVDGQIGLEATPDEYVARLVAVFAEVRRALRDDGTCWVNLGDSYSSHDPGGYRVGEFLNPDGRQSKESIGARNRAGTHIEGVKRKNLLGIPWRVAFALQADGWYLRQDIIWAKPNPMPESVTDRCTKAHEYLFLLTKNARYFWDAEAMKEPAIGKPSGNKAKSWGTNETETRADGVGDVETMRGIPWDGATNRNRRSVWTIAPKPYKGAHFAVMPPALVEQCILAGSRPGDVALDPFNGSGTTGAVAIEHGRRYVGIELNPEYVTLSRARIEGAQRQPSLALESAA